MACFPKIDQPCPLDVASQKRINGFCGRCGKTVHALDGLSDAERADFMRKATGSVCVSYALTVGIGAALALSVADPVAAAQVEASADSSRPVTSSQPAAGVPGMHHGDSNSAPAHSPIASGEEYGERFDLIFVGGIRSPGDADWIDDDSLPDLPMFKE